jgi:PBSX family phage terminase large subunit
VSTPSLSAFNPKLVPYQYRVVRDVRKRFNYGTGPSDRRVHEILLSGSVGSAKSILAAHLGVTHCLMYPKARLALCRRAMPDLKETILATVLEHMEEDLVEGQDYEMNRTRGIVNFSNGSQIVSRSWADRKFKRFRSVLLSAAIVEELTENDERDKTFYTELRGRLNRLPHIPESWIIGCTNPDSPKHWAYRYFIERAHALRHVYYSSSLDNPFLGKSYVEGLLESYDAKMAQRLVYGKWIEIDEESVYHAYGPENFRNYDYKVDPRLAIHLNFDFNIGHGKPMSVCLHQIDRPGQFHYFDEVVVEGARTESILEECAERGLFDHPVEYRVHGDAAGKNRDTRSLRSDYDIIKTFLANYKTKSGEPIRFAIEVPAKNPPIRTRHNLVNGMMKNAKGEQRLFVYRKCRKLDEGFRLVSLKEGAQYIEDDSKDYQHVTTAAGYGIYWQHLAANSSKQGTVLL